jgi:hypothetical protein
VVGFGGDVPAFLLRSTFVPKRPRVEEPEETETED